MVLIATLRFGTKFYYVIQNEKSEKWRKWQILLFTIANFQKFMNQYFLLNFCLASVFVILIEIFQFKN